MNYNADHRHETLLMERLPALRMQLQKISLCGDEKSGGVCDRAQDLLVFIDITASSVPSEQREPFFERAITGLSAAGEMIVVEIIEYISLCCRRSQRDAGRAKVVIKFSFGIV